MNTKEKNDAARGIQVQMSFVVYGRIGSPLFIDTKNFPTCFTGERRGHSRKPQEFYDTVRRVTAGSRIDVFAREQRDGFATYGDKTQKFSAPAPPPREVTPEPPPPREAVPGGDAAALAEARSAVVKMFDGAHEGRAAAHTARPVGRSRHSKAAAMTDDRATTQAEFILAEALKLDIRIGTNGDDLLVVYPRTKLPRETYRYFSRAIFEHREAIMAHIIAENRPCQTT